MTGQELHPKGRLRTSRQSFCISTLHGGHYRMRGNDGIMQVLTLDDSS